MAWWSARENSTAASPVRIPGGQNPGTLFLVGVIIADVVNLWFKISDGIGGRPDWAVSSDI